MLDFLSLDPNLLFPNIPELAAIAIELFMLLADMVLLVLLVIAEWKIFKKIGEKPWKSLIPFYSRYTLHKHVWTTSAFWVYLVSSVAFTVFTNAPEMLTAFRPDSIWVTLFMLLAIPVGIVETIYTILLYFRLAESFGKKLPFKIGMIFFNSIFSIILGFGKSKFIGKDGIDKDSDENGSPAIEAEEQKEGV